MDYWYQNMYVLDSHFKACMSVFVKAIESLTAQNIHPMVRRRGKYMGRLWGVQSMIYVLTPQFQRIISNMDLEMAVLKREKAYDTLQRK